MHFVKKITVLILVLHLVLLPFSIVRVLAEPSALSFLFNEGGGASSGQEYNPVEGPSYPLIQNSYFTDDSGNILMIVNVLGEVNRQGQVVVRENADFATILALVGGLKKTANLKKVIVARQEPDKNGAMAYKIDLNQFYGDGDRSAFIALKPNDTIIIPGKKFDLDIISRVAGIAFSGISIYSIINK